MSSSGPPSTSTQDCTCEMMISAAMIEQARKPTMKPSAPARSVDEFMVSDTSDQALPLLGRERL